MEIPTRYNPQEVENKIYKRWITGHYFHATPDPKKEPFTIVIPPPNITGILHMGHALNNTIQDVLVRFRRMQGYEALWMPGTDHAGIATQNVVEKDLAKEGLRKDDIGRAKFQERLWQWTNKYGSTILGQLKKLGASCDWDRTRFTLDDGYSEAVKEAFVRLYEKGLIYQGEYIINWCPRCRTALSDEEAPRKDVNGWLYHIKYPIMQGTTLIGHAIVATTRPETMLGDTAIAINPHDERHAHLKGSRIILPLMERELTVIEDDLIDRGFGTGVVKVTPAHDPVDFALARKYDLPFINIMNDDATLNEHAGDFCGMDRFEAREALIAVLEEKKLIEKKEPYKISAGHCYRCHTIIEPRLSLQWFVNMKPLTAPAIAAVNENKITFYPERWKKVYLNWMNNIQDWCISRQIWWGHQLPVYYCKSCYRPEGRGLASNGQSHRPEGRGLASNGQSHRPETRQSMSSSAHELMSSGTKKPGASKGIIVSKTKPEKCPDCGGNEIVQDTDVLDTWFSSWLWPFATFYWPAGRGLASSPEGQYSRNTVEREVHSQGHGPYHQPGSSSAHELMSLGAKSPGTLNLQQEDLKYFYPTSTLVTASEILFFWVARMIMAGLEFMGEIPFKDVIIHGTVRDEQGIKMSKSLGNIIDPLAIIDKFGADPLRFSLMLTAASGSDVYLSDDKFLVGRNFCNKIWNA
ncbi:MAG: valine--tRNA ligase, partial [Candidatus Omnitrophica bacterium]|nr:valine--tRNA ligase [Candidatus Omnitrophota bacterium]